MRVLVKVLDLGKGRKRRVYRQATHEEAYAVWKGEAGPGKVLREMLKREA